MKKPDPKVVSAIVESALREDLGDGDHTSLSTIPSAAYGKAELIAKATGVVAGIQVAETVFKKVDKDLQFRSLIEDGQEVKPGDVIFSVSGKRISILSAERLALNFMQRMSGIATMTRHVVQKVSGTSAKILDTRKTTPNLRLLEKYAVAAGGGHNHRSGLYDMIMIKDNHIDFAGGISKAIDACQAYLQKNNKSLEIEVEVRDFKELDEVLKHGGVQRIMLDNFSPADITKALQLIGPEYQTEASGGITLDNVREYAETGIEYISMGALTHHIKSLDMSLKAVK